MKFNNRFILLGASVMLMTSSAYAANSTAMMMSAEAADDGANDHAGTAAAIAAGSSGSANPVAVSRGSLIDNETTRKLPFSLSGFSMFNGPGFQNFSTSAPNSQQPYAGVSARHELKLDYAVNRRVTLSPTMDVSETFYNNPAQGALVVNDPSLRLAIADVNYAKFGKTTFDASIWVSAYAPVSAISQQLHEYTAASIAYLPKLHFRGSRFFLSGVAEAKANFMDNQAQTGLIAPLNLVSGLQGNYRVSQSTTVFMMDHLATNVGPSMGQIMVQTPIGSQNPRQKAKTQAQGQNPVSNGITVGSSFQVLRGISLSPRLDWSTDQQIGTTTIGVNASFHII